MNFPLKSTDISERIRFNSIIDKRFKTNRISINLITTLAADTVTLNALLPFVLKKASANCNDFTEFNRKLELLYGAYVGGNISKCGDLQIMSITICTIDDKFTLNNEPLTEQISEILCNLILNPVLVDGVFKSSEVKLEKVSLTDTIEAIINDKRSLAIENLIKTMCANEPFGIPKLGFVDKVSDITEKSLYEAYKKLIDTATIEIMFVGCGDDTKALKVFNAGFCGIDGKKNTSSITKTHKMSDKIIEKTDYLQIGQAKLVLGFGSNIKDNQVTAVKLMVAILGGTPTSKLFLNVRERLSLCYYCAARYDRFKGIMLIDSGVEFQNIKKAKTEIIRQLGLMQEGEITENEINDARLSLKNALNSVNDADNAIESFYLGQLISGTKISPQAEALALDSVTLSDVIEVAKCFKLDTVYLLTGDKNNC